MGNFQFNIVKGRVVELFNRVDSNDPTNAAIVCVLFSAIEDDDTLRDYDDLATLLGGSNTESAFTNYAREVWDDTDITLAVPDDVNDYRIVDVPDIVITQAGLGDGPGFEDVVKLIMCYDNDSTGGTDANLIPMLAYDLSVTVDESDLTITPGTGTIAFRAQ